MTNPPMTAELAQATIAIAVLGSELYNLTPILDRYPADPLAVELSALIKGFSMAVKGAAEDDIERSFNGK